MGSQREEKSHKWVLWGLKSAKMAENQLEMVVFALWFPVYAYVSTRGGEVVFTHLEGPKSAPDYWDYGGPIRKKSVRMAGNGGVMVVPAFGF